MPPLHRATREVALEWCHEECPGTCRHLYGDRAGRVVAHLHMACWQCGAEITSLTTCYHCGRCDCNGSSVPTESYAHESFDPDLARTLSSPA